MSVDVVGDLEEGVYGRYFHDTVKAWGSIEVASGRLEEVLDDSCATLKSRLAAYDVDQAVVDDCMDWVVPASSEGRQHPP